MALYVIKPAFNSKGEIRYVVVKVDKPDRGVLRARRLSTLSRYTTALLYTIVNPNCVDIKASYYMNRFLDEDTFRQIMLKYIQACYKSPEAFSKRLATLKAFIERPAKTPEAGEGRRGRRYPVAISLKDGVPIVADKIVKKAAAKYSFGEGDMEVFLFSKSFWVWHDYYNYIIALPYDIEQIDPEAVAGLDKYAVRAVADAVDTLERAVEIGEVEAWEVSRVMEAMKYTLLLRELMRDGGG